MQIEPWVHRPLLKLALLWAPAAALLVWLKLRKVRSVILYALSASNLLCYPLWLGAISLRAAAPFVAAPFVLVAIPLAATAGSFLMLIATIFAKPGEHRFLVPANLLMLILWGSSMVAPN
jgi:hypothetical protein